MSDKVKYVIFTLLDFALTWGGTAGIIVYNYITPDTSTGYKLTLSGIVLVVVLLLSAKSIFEKKYQETHNTLLQQLAEATDFEVKRAISAKIEQHKTANYVYNRLTMLLPFAILYVVTYLGAVALQDLHSTTGLILASMGAGSVFNVIKQPVKDRVQLQKMTSKVRK